MSATAKPNGAAAAAMVAASVGCCALAVLAAIGDAAKSAASLLTFWKPTGPLSGVSTLAIGLWLIVWVVLDRRWRAKDCAWARVNLAVGALLAIAFLLTFPPVEDLLLGK